MNLKVHNANNLPLTDYRELIPLQGRLKDLDNKRYNKLKKSLNRFGFIVPFFVWIPNKDETVIIDGETVVLKAKSHCTIDGHQRDLVLKMERAQPYQLPYLEIEAKNFKEAKEKILVISSQYGKTTQEGLDAFSFDLDDDFILETTEFDSLFQYNLPQEEEEQDYNKNDNGNNSENNTKDGKKLVDKFLVPPFSILDTKMGYWQDRKRTWLDIGIKSEEGRDNALAYNINQGNYDPNKEQGSTSIFDPVLCELIYSWFCINGGVIVDPFAGGSVRGIVAQYLGCQYYGIDLRAEQINANRLNQKEIFTNDNKKNIANWTTGDSLSIDVLLKGIKADLIFSCPPYHDLEQYSKLENDISNMDYSGFIITLHTIIKKSVELLNDNSFACFVVGDIRDKKGFYRNFVSDTINGFLACGMKLYNEIILVNVAGSLPMRVSAQFNNSRKIGKMHQNVLVFYKGDVKKIKNKFGELDFSELEENKENE